MRRLGILDQESGYWRAAAVCLLGLSLAGCLTLADDRPRLPAAALPDYVAGDSFLYTSDRWERVLEVGKDKVVWAGPGSDRIERTRNFILTGTKWRAVPTNQAGWVGGPDTIWPLRVGATAEFYEVFDDGERRWRCRVTGTRRAEIAAGRFDVFRIRCRSGRAPGPAYEKVWYFAPEIGHYVLYLYRRDGKIRWRSELLARVPDLSRQDGATRASINRVFQDALEKSLSGTELVSPRSGKGPVAAITPTATYRDQDGTYCRTYRLVLRETSRDRPYPGVACRSGDGVWRVPQR